MQVAGIEKYCDKIAEDIARKRIKSAFDRLKVLIEETRSGTLKDQLLQLESTYINMLQYTLQGVVDPEREKIYSHLLRALLKLADKTRENLLSTFSGWFTFQEKNKLEKEQILTGKAVVEKLEDLSFKMELDEILEETKVLPTARQNFESPRHTQIVSQIFNHLWLSDTYKEAEKDLIQTFLDTEKFHWYERSLFVSAITLSALRYFDVTKFDTLYKLYKLKEEEVWQRALTGLLIAFYRFDDRIHLYPRLKAILKELSGDEEFENILEMILLQLTRSGETENIAKKIRDEIVPEMTKLAPKLTDKLELDKLIPDDFLEDKNPDWSKIFKDSEGLYEKIEEFSRLQMEGADVFMSAFSQLKRFPFFSEISNWFLPFHPDNPVIDEAFAFEDPEFDKDLFLKGLQKTGYMCNSDKYSFCLNVKLMPVAQKSMMLKLFQAELKGMEEMNKEDEVLDYTKTTRTIFTQYIHDLYRFFKVFTFHDEFYDFFKASPDFTRKYFFGQLVTDEKLIRKIAEYYFQNDHFEKATGIYLTLDIREDPEILEKIAFSYQRLKDFEKALIYYKQAELFNANKEWLLKKIGLCYRKLYQPEQALEYYKRASNVNPDNLYTQASIGHCYLDLKDYDAALEYFFKVEYLDSKNTKVWRPIAWCSFVQGKMDVSDKYYRKIELDKPNQYDLLNMGHLNWCMGNKEKAFKYYKESIRKKGNTYQKFLAAFESDRPHLLANGIDEKDIPILLDYLQYQLPGM